MQAKEQANPGKKKDIDMTKIRRAKREKNLIYFSKNPAAYSRLLQQKLLINYCSIEL